YRKLAVQHGATILTHSRVENVSVHKEMASVETDSQTFNADSLIVSARAWSNKILNQLGLELPRTPVRRRFGWFETNESLYNEKYFPAFAFETADKQYYGFPSTDGTCLK